MLKTSHQCKFVAFIINNLSFNSELIVLFTEDVDKPLFSIKRADDLTDLTIEHILYSHSGMLTDCQNYFTAKKRMKFSTKYV